MTVQRLIHQPTLDHPSQQATPGGRPRGARLCECGLRVHTLTHTRVHVNAC